jgi:hypothetical protein
MIRMASGGLPRDARLRRTQGVPDRAGTGGGSLTSTARTQSAMPVARHHRDSFNPPAQTLWTLLRSQNHEPTSQITIVAT